MVTLRRTWHVHFDTDAEELLAGVQVGMVAGPRCRTHSHAAERARTPGQTHGGTPDVKDQVGLPRFDGQGWWLGQATCLTTSLSVFSPVRASNSLGVM
jgi:hypothetical protein